ncbi:2-dehydropantoate 2-reductase [Candidatus Burkholderia pumila]|uniref:2-dehydropantoate 2-reductase n=1 Tax=Candidatus Burkholderia pumila TaxID=1090375 RepID=A0ABR5HJN7_9BURK|nr:2-dehydropantoate 2-reductase [Candidatus Burkholderia pumila]
MKVAASASPEALGQQNLVIVAVKTPAMQDVAAHVKPLLGPQTIERRAVVVLRRPRRFIRGQTPDIGRSGRFHHCGDSFFPKGGMCRAYELFRRIAGRDTASARHGSYFGEAKGKPSERVDELVSLFAKAGFDVSASPQIQRDVWFKLWGTT